MLLVEHESDALAAPCDLWGGAAHVDVDELEAFVDEDLGGGNHFLGVSPEELGAVEVAAVGPAQHLHRAFVVSDDG